MALCSWATCCKIRRAMSKQSLVARNIRLEECYPVQVRTLLLHPPLRKRHPLLLLRVKFLLQLSVTPHHCTHLLLQILDFLSVALLQTYDLSLQLRYFVAEKLDFLVFVFEKRVESGNLLVGDLKLEFEFLDLAVLLLDGVPEVGDGFLLLVGGH